MKCRLLVSRQAFTWVEILAIVAAVFLLISLLIPAGAKAKARAARSSCICSLKQIGVAYRIYANDHAEHYPWEVPMAQTGSLEYALSPQVFRHFMVASNELVTPKILRCPTDRAKSVATKFASFSNTNLSYFIGLDAGENNPQALLSGDRNIQNGSLSNGFLLTLTTTSRLTWTAELHKRVANVALADGSVQQLGGAVISNQFGANRLAIP
jgi:prepilin-type processing-associated H-X9-DG protein